ncbi:MAG: imidazolonepropionase [Tissierellia bacterium]|nr:imidazolonepropionase [Tissierellia bacterium]
MGKILLKNCEKIHTLDNNLQDILGTLDGHSILIDEEVVKRIDKYENLLDLLDDETKIIECKGKSVLPGFVDPHTHLVFGGDRKEEYMARLTINDAEAIQEIAGTLGMAGSVEKTKAAGFDGLIESSIDKLNNLLINGITTVEIKSGYGIDKDTELMQLRVIQELKNKVPQTLIATYLGGHDWDKEMGKDAYVDFCINEVMPVIEKEKLADMADIWVEEQFFSVEQGRRYLKAAKKHGINGTIHGNELSSVGASKMAAEEGVYSVAHLNYLTDEEIDLMIENDVVGILLPTTDYVKQYMDVLADGRKFIDKGMTVAMATNINPGNYTVSMSLVMNMACRNHGLSGEEALKGATVNAAKALRIDDKYGTIEEGKFADIQIWDTNDFRDVIYKQGVNYVNTVIKHGQIVVEEGVISYL